MVSTDSPSRRLREPHSAGLTFPLPHGEKTRPEGPEIAENSLSALPFAIQLFRKSLRPD